MLPQIVKILCIIQCAVNLIIPLRVGFVWKFSIFQLVVAVTWIFAMLTSTGVLCRNLHEVQNGMALYEQNLAPALLIIAVTRILEFLFYFILRRSSINWTLFIIIVIADVILFVILYFDKLNYGYAKEIVDEENNNA